MRWDTLPEESVIEKTVAQLEMNGIEVFVVQDRQKAKEKAISLIPRGSQVFTATSTTAEESGITREIEESDEYESVRKLITREPDEAERLKKRRASTPDYVVGSVHAVTQDGHALVASNSGSQIPLYAFAAEHVLWVVGAQKIVRNIEEGIRRIYEYSLKLEEERVRKNQGEGSSVNKILIVNKEKIQGRITMIIVKEVIGF